MKNQDKLFIGWLKDAYSMEKSIENTLKVHAKEAKKYPQVRDKIMEHIESTKSQAERIKERLKELGEKPSGIKAFSKEIVGTLKGNASRFAEDKIIRNTLADIATEAFEISTYKTLIMAAERIGDEKTKEALESILQEEEEMSGWAEENLPVLVDEFFEKETKEGEENGEEEEEEEEGEEREGGPGEEEEEHEENGDVEEEEGEGEENGGEEEKMEKEDGPQGM